MPAPDGSDDFSGVCGPNEWLWHLVGLLDESIDCGLKLDNGVKDAALQPLLGQFGEIALHCIEPGAGRGGEVKAKALVACQPSQNGGMLVSGVVVENDVDGFSGWDLGVDGVEKAYELLVAVTLHAAANHLALQHVERREERRRAVALVIVGHSSGAAFLQGKAGLRAVQCLDLAHMGICGSRCSDQVFMVNLRSLLRIQGLSPFA
jgi:intracellular sulfur oxidation DsrE/DsrF family protein